MPRNSTEFPLPKIRHSLLRWYTKNKRPLPWRDTKDPYSIWLSEIMLQQTTVETVIPYFKKFLKKFPTLHHLAEALEEDFLKAWQGLGYYNRIRNFQKACQIIRDRYEGVIPSSKDKLMKLPGLGNYTAGAVSSIAFGKVEPVVDGNIYRVLARFFNFKKDISKTESIKFFWAKAGEWVDPKSPGDFNQALMELGATVCTPNNPQCLLCPLRQGCIVQKKGNPEDLPIKLKKINYQKEYSLCFLFYHQGKLLFRKRAKEEILSGLWELPRVITSRPVPQQKPTATIQKLLKKGDWPSFSKILPLSEISHSIMNRRLKIKPVFLMAKNKKLKRAPYLWVPLQKTKDYPLTTITNKIIKSKQLQKLMENQARF